MSLTAPLSCAGISSASKTEGGGILSSKPERCPPPSLESLDRMWDESSAPRAEAFDLSQRLLQRYADDSALLWRAARAAYGLSEEKALPPSRKKELLQLSLQQIRSAKASMPESAAADGRIYRWSGIILSAQGQFMSTSDYIKNAFDIRDDFAHAVQVNPSDASAHHLLGRWHYDVASSSWLTRQAAALFFATPPSSTFEAALAEYELAERISPGFWKANALGLARSSHALGRREDALRWLRASLKVPIKSIDDENAHADSEALWKSIDKASFDAYISKEGEGHR